jgi:uncharacterized protein YjbI with pentapeptide repeats
MGEVSLALIIVLCLAALVLLSVAIIGHRRGWEWTGLRQRYYETRDGYELVPAKTLWDWLQLLVIPLALAGLAFLLNQSQSRRDADQADARAAIDRGIAFDARQEDTLRTYIDAMSALMLEQKLRQSTPRSEVRTVAQTRTFVVLRRLDGERQGQVLRFLADADLLDRPEPVVDLEGANLDGAYVGGADLRNTHLRGVSFRRASLPGANLRGANLSKAVFEHAQMNDVLLIAATVTGADFFRAEMIGAKLMRAKGSGAWFSEAKLWRANLRDSTLDFKGAEVSSNTTLSNGKHPKPGQEVIK